MMRRLQLAIAAGLIAAPALAAAQGHGATKTNTARQEAAAQKHQHGPSRSGGIVGSSSASGTGSGTANDMRR